MKVDQLCLTYFPLLFTSANLFIVLINDSLYLIIVIGKHISHPAHILTSDHVAQFRKISIPSLPGPARPGPAL